jgi:predicted nucleic acid-binding protein
VDQHRNWTAGIVCEIEQKGWNSIDIYCDTSSLFSNADRHQDAKARHEAAAISSLLELHRQGKIRLLRSNVIRRELERTRSTAQKDALLGDFLELVSIANDEKVLGFDTQHTDPYGGLVTTPLVSDVQDEPLVEKLHKELSLPILDAQHLAQAISNGADVFLTRDEEHFISQRQTIETQFKIKIRLPSEALVEI